MVLSQPEQCAADEKTPDLITAIIEDVGFPVRMEALARVLMLIKMSAIEKAQSMAICRKMRRYPIEDDPNSMSVEFVDQIHEVLRSSVIARGSKIPGGLVPPRAKKRVIHDGQKFHMSEPHVLEICRQ